MIASHLDFYTSQKISPVRQDVSDIRAHFERRGALYRMLGVLPATIRGSRVLEVGPGSGHNAIFTGSMKPSRYLLVEGNETGINHMQKLFSDHSEYTDGIEIVHSALEDWDTDEEFDVVLCEGLMSGVANPEEILQKLSRVTAQGGVLVTTCVDHISHFPETIRRAFAQSVISDGDSLDHKVAKILPMMIPHLETLDGMSRRADDWVIDNLIHPGSIIPLVNIPETIVTLAKECDFLSASPNFFVDWRWYKSLVGEAREFNIPAIEQYWENMHNLIDYRVTSPSRDGMLNQRLYALCTKARATLERYEHTHDKDHFSEFAQLVGEISSDLKGCMPDAAEALNEAKSLLDVPEFDAGAVSSLEKFNSLFGRGQQYISFTRSVV